MISKSMELKYYLMKYLKNGKGGKIMLKKLLESLLRLHTHTHTHNTIYTWKGGSLLFKLSSFLIGLPRKEVQC